nr:zinc finger protein 37-like [Nerophis lumbriciformis]
MVEEFVSVVTDTVPELLTNSQRTQLLLGLRTRKGCPNESRPSYNEALKSLMEILLSRLEGFLPGQTFKQVASTCDEVSSALGECLKSMHGYDELKTVLHYHKNQSQHKHINIPSDDISAPERAAVKDHCFQETTTFTASPNEESISDTADQLGRESDESYETDEWDSEETTDKEDNTDVPGPKMDSCAQGKTLDGCSPSRPVRSNRGLKMKMILMEEKKGLNGEENRPVEKNPPSQIQAPITSTPDSSDNKDDGGECSSWSFYTDDDSLSLSSWSRNSTLSDDDVPEVTRDSSSPISLHEDTSDIETYKAIPIKKVPRRSGPSKKPRKTKCFICNEQVSTNLDHHIKTIHFPNGDYTCHKCNTRYKSLASLRTHLVKTCYDQAQQQLALYKCDLCEKGFRYKVSLDAHKQTHNELYCSVCRKVLKDAATLERHKASHTQTGFHCTRCEETFPGFKPLRSHYNHFHNLSKPFQCKCCSNTYSKLEYLIRHEWRSSGHLPFQCNICSMRFKNDSTLVSHQRVHTKEKPYLCGDCGKTFSQRTNFLRHYRFLHGDSKNEKKYFCTVCQSSFKAKGALTKHHKKKHLKELVRHLCPYCGKTFSASAIARHKLLHTGERPLKCSVPGCDKSFLSAPEKKRHVLMHHSTERPFKCDTCGKGFITVGFRNAHSKVHLGKRPFQCYICFKAFPKLYNLIRHKQLSKWIGHLAPFVALKHELMK